MAMFALYGNFSGVTLIAINRCIGIVYSHVIQLKRRHALIMIAFSWVYSFSIAIPTTYDGFSANATYNSGTHHCSPYWKGSNVYNTVCLVLLYGVTAPVMIVSYTLIIREIRKREAQVKKYSGCGSENRVKTIELSSRNGELATKSNDLVSFSSYHLGEQDHNNVTISTISTGNLEKETASTRIVMTHRGIVFKGPDVHGKLPSHGKIANRSSAGRLGADKRVALAGGLLVLTSTLCWAPYYMVHAIVGSSMHGLDVFSMWLGYSNSALDPFIYYLLSQRIRTALKEIWGKLLRKGRCQKTRL
ncbi:5-hydroxytryptamine receptor 1A [Holothuria leucospilota]|uniref:5-hydroxytryptamine receptor 1A n=1 Tax=Holothuria leucospilota TaxID=206669 RepID=A0A9Q1HD39_HOLLE|nr:5-hydroxytryptamine receptor 1A [Holothuria leucospilota]